MPLILPLVRKHSLQNPFLKKPPKYIIFFVLILTSQISQTQKGLSGSSTQKMKSLRSSPCEEPEDHNILFRYRYSLLLCIRKEYYLKNSSQSSCDGVVCLSHNVQDPLNESLCPTLSGESCSGSSGYDSVCTFSHFHSSLNTLIVYSEIIWCLSLFPKARRP